VRPRAVVRSARSVGRTGRRAVAVGRHFLFSFPAAAAAAWRAIIAIIVVMNIERSLVAGRSRPRSRSLLLAGSLARPSRYAAAHQGSRKFKHTHHTPRHHDRATPCHFHTHTHTHTHTHSARRARRKWRPTCLSLLPRRASVRKRRAHYGWTTSMHGCGLAAGRATVAPPRGQPAGRKGRT